MTKIDKIRDALNSYERIVRHTEQLGVSQQERRATIDAALAALAELERAAAEPVAWMWNDMLGIPQVYASQKRPTWPDAGSSPAMAVAINVRPLYTAPPPAPVAEMCEPTPEECVDMAEWFKSECQECCINPQESADYGRAIFDAVKLVMGGES